MGYAELKHCLSNFTGNSLASHEYFFRILVNYYQNDNLVFSWCPDEVERIRLKERSHVMLRFRGKKGGFFSVTQFVMWTWQPVTTTFPRAQAVKPIVSHPRLFSRQYTQSGHFHWLFRSRCISLIPTFWKYTYQMPDVPDRTGNDADLFALLSEHHPVSTIRQPS